MKCIKCGSEMRIGRIESKYDMCVFWMKRGSYLVDDSKPIRSMKKALQEEEAELIGEVSTITWMTKKKPCAFFCGNCRLIVVDMNIEDYREA